MAQKRKKRTIEYIVKITVFTDFMEQFVCGVFENCIKGIKNYEESQKRLTSILVEKNVVYKEQKSKCCKALMVGGMQCENCGSNGE